MFGFHSDVIVEYWPLFLNGAFMTVKITVICVLLGVMLGTLLGMGRLADSRHEPLKSILHYGVRWPVAVYVSFFPWYAAFCADLFDAFCGFTRLYSSVRWSSH